MMCDQADDPLTIGSRQHCARIGNAEPEPVDPEPPVGIEHDFDDRRVFKPGPDLGPERRAQHARTTRCCLGPDRNNAHRCLAIAGTDNRPA